MALKTLQSCVDSSWPEQMSALRAINTLNPPKKYIRKLGRLSSIYLKRRRGVQGLMWGARGPFPPATAMVVAVVTPVVFCAKATSEVESKVILMGHPISCCHAPVVRSFFIHCKVIISP